MKLALTSKCQEKERQRNMSPLLSCPNLGSLSRRQVLSSLFSPPPFCHEKSQTEAQKIIVNRRKPKNRKQNKKEKVISKKLSLRREPEQRQARQTILVAPKQITPMLLTCMCVAFIIISSPSNQVPSGSKQLHSKAPLSLLNVDLNQITPQPLFLSPSASSNQHPGEYPGVDELKQ